MSTATLTRQPLEVQLSCLPVTELSAAQAAACRSLTLREEGSMSGSLTLARQKGWDHSRVILAHDLEGRLVGWCLMFNRDFVHFFVRNSVRRRGVGSALMRESLRLSERVWVEAHDETSWYFFNRFKQDVEVGGLYLHCPYEHDPDEEEWD